MSWNWQKYKDDGQPIYEAQLVGNMIHLKKMKRVIHESYQFGESVVHSVRYLNRWQPLHKAERLLHEMDTPKGILRVYLNGKRLADSDDKLPFLCKWEEQGSYYEVFGY